jgi:hypothetical protein
MTKKTFIILTSIVLLLTVVALGIWLYPKFAPVDVSQYNLYATLHARSTGLISNQDILILNTIDRKTGDDSLAEFNVYRLPNGANADEYLKMDASEVGDKLELMGAASCGFTDDNPTAVKNLKVRFLK